MNLPEVWFLWQNAGGNHTFVFILFLPYKWLLIVRIHLNTLFIPVHHGCIS